MEVGRHMDGKRNQSAIKKIRRRTAFLAGNSRGETLVEAIVSFALVLVVMLGVMAILQTAISLNRRASARMDELEADTAAIEADQGPLSSAQPDGELILDFGDTQIEVPVVLHEGDLLNAYMPIPGGYLS